MVGVQREPTVAAMEARLAGPIGPLAMAAGRTRLAAIAGVHRHDGHAGPLGFVFHEPSQLGECPVAKSLPKPLGSGWLGSGANARKVFYRNPKAECLCLGNESLADGVVHDGLKAPLPTRHSLQSPLGVLGPLSLVLLTGHRTPSPVPLNCLTRKCFPSRVGCQVLYAEVNAEPVLRLNRRGFVEFDRDAEEPLPVSVDEVGLPSLLGKRLFEVVSHKVRNFDSSAEDGNANHLRRGNSVSPIGTRNGTHRGELGADPPTEGKPFNCLRNRPNSDVGGEVKPLSDVSVAESMNRHLSEDTVLESNPGRFGRGGVDRPHRSGQLGRLFGSRKQTELAG